TAASRTGPGQPPRMGRLAELLTGTTVAGNRARPPPGLLDLLLGRGAEGRRRCAVHQAASPGDSAIRPPPSLPSRLRALLERVRGVLGASSPGSEALRGGASGKRGSVTPLHHRPASRVPALGLGGWGRR